MKEAEHPTDKRESTWDKAQEMYWSKLAPHYDTFYADEWSRAEDEQARNIIASILSKNSPTIVDIGCGTGLGYRLLSSIPQRNFQYIGIDISPQMMGQLRYRHPEATGHVLPMEKADSIGEEVADNVLMLNSVFSYGSNASSTLRAVKRILRPGGQGMISCLSRFSLRRLLRLDFKNLELFRTRNSEENLPPVHAFTYTSSQISTLIQQEGLIVKVVLGQSILGGVWQSNSLIGVDRFWGATFPNLAHSLIIIIQKPKA